MLKSIVCEKKEKVLRLLLRWELVMDGLELDELELLYEYATMLLSSESVLYDIYVEYLDTYFRSNQITEQNIELFIEYIKVLISWSCKKTYMYGKVSVMCLTLNLKNGMFTNRGGDDCVDIVSVWDSEQTLFVRSHHNDVAKLLISSGIEEKNCCVSEYAL